MGTGRPFIRCGKLVLSWDHQLRQFASETVVWDFVGTNVLMVVVTLYIVGLLSKTRFCCQISRNELPRQPTKVSGARCSIKAKQDSRVFFERSACLFGGSFRTQNFRTT